MSIKITKSAEETYRRMLHTLQAKYKGKEYIIVLDDDDNGATLEVYDTERKILSDSDVRDALLNCFGENSNPSDLTLGTEFVYNAEDEYWEEV
tara:strand:+ start:134 stop:412 length:279 start_codon:yes stop_codon:yes gene_type:complete